MEDENRQKLIQIVRRWGGTNSDAALDPSCKIFSIAHVDGCIAYRFEKSCIVIYGDPLCAPSDIPLLAYSFHEFCKTQNMSVIYIVASQNYQRWAIQNVCASSIAVGEELMLNPYDDPRARAGVNGSLVRRKVRHAEHEGLRVEEYQNNNPKTEQEMEKVSSAWLKNRRGPQLHISNVFLFNDRPGKRWFYAKRKNQIVGVLVLNRLESRQGWLFNHLMTTPDSPHGTPESLVIGALDALRNEGCNFATFGDVPVKQINEITGFGLFSTGLARLLYNMTSLFFHLDNRKMFWEKFHPDSHPSYLLFSNPSIGIREIRGLIRALHFSFTPI